VVGGGFVGRFLAGKNATLYETELTSFVRGL